MTVSGRPWVPWSACLGAAGLATVLGAALQGQAGGQLASSASAPQELVAGTPTGRDLRGGEQHEFRLQLSAAQFVHLVVDQQGIDVVVIVVDPSGAEIARMDSPNGDSGPEIVTLVSEQAGAHRVLVSALDPRAKSGRYEARLPELRAATPQDRAFVQARSLSLEAARGVQANTALALRQGIEKYRLAAPLWLAAGKPEVEAGTFHSITVLAHRLGDFPQAEAAAAEAAAKFGALGDQRNQAIGLTNFGKAAAAQRQWQRALAAHERALALAEASSDSDLQATIWRNAAQVYRSTRDTARALEYERRVRGHRRSVAPVSSPGPLAPGQALTADIKPAELHRYRLDLDADTFVHVRIDQLGANVEVAVENPVGEILAERDRPESSTDPEPVSFVSAAPGAYAVVVMLKEGAAPGRYRVEWRDRRRATDGDRRRIAAEQTLAAGDRLFRPETLAGAIAEYESILPVWRDLGEAEWEAFTLMQLAWAHRFLGDLDQALVRLNAAAARWEVVDDARQASRVQNVLAVLHLQQGNARASIEPSMKALRLSERTGSLESQASALSNLSAAYWMLGDRQAEMDYQARSVEVARRIGDEGRLAGVLQNRGVSLMTVGRYQEALVDLREALRIRHGSLAYRDEAATLNAIAEVYRELGRLAEAQDYHTRALALRRQTADRDGTGESLNNLGLLYRALGQPDKARESFIEALQLRRDAKNLRGEATALLNIAALNYVEGSDYPRALDDLERAMAIHRELDNLPGQASVLRHLGRVHELLGREAEARQHYERAVDLARQVHSDMVQIDALKALAELDARQGALTDALVRVRSAIALVDAGRRALFGDTFRSAFLAANADLHDLQVDVLMRLHASQPTAGYDGQALAAAERSRARSLLDSLEEARVNLSAGIAPALVQAEQDLRARIDVAARQLAALTGAKDAAKRAAADSAMNDLLTEYHELRGRIHAASPRLAALDDAGAVSIARIQSEIVDRDTVLLEYSLGGDRSYLWVVTPTELRSFVLPRRAEIEAMARRAHDLLTVRNRRPAGETADQWRARIARADRDLQPALTALSQAVLAPAAPLLAGRRLLVVASGALQYVPFAVLPMPGRTAPVAASNEVVTLPSASTLAALRSRPAGRPEPTRTVAVLADPVFDAEDGRLAAAGRPQPADRAAPRAGGEELAPVDGWQAAARGTDASIEGGRLPRLRYSRDEASAIQKLVGPDDRLVALDFAANREMALGDRLRDFRIVHFAAHGFVNSEFPELSGIALSMVDERGQPVDGFLRLHQIYGLTLPVDLVVLSACQTALGKDVRGEGIVGLTRGFMYAGAIRVVSTLWKVDDQATAELMKVFYEGMLGPRKLRPAEALRAAQLAVSRQDRWRNPYYWAAFTLQGEWR